MTFTNQRKRSQTDEASLTLRHLVRSERHGGGDKSKESNNLEALHGESCRRNLSNGTLVFAVEHHRRPTHAVQFLRASIEDLAKIASQLPGYEKNILSRTESIYGTNSNSKPKSN